MPDNKLRVAIKSLFTDKGLYGSDGKTVTAIFDVGHNNGTTTLKQELILTQVHDGWVASMDMSDIPPSKTITASAWQLAEWMERMAEAIKANTFDQININSL